MATTIPTPTFGPTGFVSPQENVVLAAVLQMIDQTFGGGLNPSLATPQGQLASSMTGIIGFVNDTFQFYTQQVDPAYAIGRMQDAIARIYFLERKPPLPTVVQALCSGGDGTVIPLGALAQASDGNIYACTQEGTIGSSGSVTLTFECQLAGSIGCPAGNLNTIYQTILGWDSIINQTDGVIGRDTETRAEFEERRFDSVANNALGFLNAVLGAVWEIEDVSDVVVTENPTGSPVSFRGVTIPAHCLYVAAAGGASDEIAKAIWSKKAPGCNTFGNTSVTVYDDVSGYDPPLPSYVINFQIPYPFPIVFNVNIVNSTLVPSDADVQIRAAINAAFAGQDGGPRARIGSTIYASRFYAPIGALGPWVQIISIKVGAGSAPDATITGSMGGGTGATGTLTVTSLTSGTVGIGMFVGGSGGGTAVQVGTQIVAQLSGSSGGTGTYSIAPRQTVPLSTLRLFSADQDDVSSQADEQPITEDILISVTLT
jgi:uncharacterized phage protein gp47/JayE